MAIALYRFGQDEATTQSAATALNGSFLPATLYTSLAFQTHAKAVVTMLEAAIVLMLGQDMKPLANTLKELGCRHVAYGVLPAHYGIVETALMRTLSAALTPGGYWTEEVRKGWGAVFKFVAKAMMAGADAEVEIIKSQRIQSHERIENAKLRLHIRRRRRRQQRRQSPPPPTAVVVVTGGKPAKRSATGRNSSSTQQSRNTDDIPNESSTTPAFNRWESGSYESSSRSRHSFSEFGRSSSSSSRTKLKHGQCLLSNNDKAFNQWEIGNRSFSEFGGCESKGEGTTKTFDTTTRRSGKKVYTLSPLPAPPLPPPTVITTTMTNMKSTVPSRNVDPLRQVSPLLHRRKVVLASSDEQDNDDDDDDDGPRLLQDGLTRPRHYSMDVAPRIPQRGHSLSLNDLHHEQHHCAARRTAAKTEGVRPSKTTEFDTDVVRSSDSPSLLLRHNNNNNNNNSGSTSCDETTWTVLSTVATVSSHSDDHELAVCPTTTSSVPYSDWGTPPSPPSPPQSVYIY
jgi:hemoglobin-like flavoprotein